ncbi:MAG: hypothetical protein KGJ13_10190 [Patescibacteria group bacterium]|nr:hypothetical protein [Patescibacteria group bacterium]
MSTAALPPLPSGYQLEQGGTPPLPPGYQLETQDQPKRTWMDSAVDYGKELLSQVNPITGIEGAYQAVRHPVATLAADSATREQIRQKAEDLFKKGNYADGAAVMLNGIVPLLGPASERAGDLMEQGKTAQALGAASGIGLNLASPKLLESVKASIPKAGPIASRLYESALKPSTTLSPAERATAAATGMENSIPVSESGLDKLAGLVKSLNDKVQTTIQNAANSGATVNKYSVAGRLGQTAQKFATQVTPESDLNAVADTGNEFLRNQPTNIPADVAQKLKSGTYTQLGNKAYGELSSASVEAQKALARGIKEELQTQFPEIKGLNAEEGKLLELQPLLERAVARISNHQLIGIGTPIMGAAGTAVTGSTGLGAVSGILKAVVDDPIVKSRLAIILNKASKGQLTIPAGLAKVSGYSNALGNAVASEAGGGQANEQTTQ